MIVVTDARFPERWLNDLRFQELSAEDFRANAYALMWCVANKTDGIVTPARLRFIPTMTEQTPPRLVAADIWVWQSADNGWYINEFTTTQTTRRELEASQKARDKEAENKRVRRSQQRLEAAEREASAGQQGVRPDVPRTGSPTATRTADPTHQSPADGPDETAGQWGVHPDVGRDVGGDVHPVTPRTETEPADRRSTTPTPSKFHEQTDQDLPLSSVRPGSSSESWGSGSSSDSTPASADPDDASRLCGRCGKVPSVSMWAGKPVCPGCRAELFGGVAEDVRVCSAQGCLSEFGLLGASAGDQRLFCRTHHPRTSSAGAA